MTHSLHMFLFLCSMFNHLLSSIKLGSISGGEDIRSFQDVGQVNHIILADLSLQDGHAVYATVRGKCLFD